MNETEVTPLEKTFREDISIKTALVSVFDKAELIPLTKKLKNFDVSIVSTGGTRTHLEGSGIRTVPLDEIVKFPEMLDGRVKTLQPEIFAGILARKNNQDHMRQISERRVMPIDMVVCNFYAFEKTSDRAEAREQELIEMIDIGGPSMVRAAAKNYESVCVVPSSDSYEQIEKELDSMGGKISFETRRKMALKAFEIVAAYDIAIYNTLHHRFSAPGSFPNSFFLSGKGFEVPKYGENPDQKAMIYSINGSYGGLPEWKQLFGDIRSYNNYLDIAGSYEILEGFEAKPAAATVKHGQISGFAFSNSISEAYRLAHACDPEADFGNTTVLNRTVDVETAKLIGKNEGVSDDSVYTEIVLAPGYESQALEVLKSKQKKKMRIILTTKSSAFPYDVKIAEGLALVQQRSDYGTKLDRSKVTMATTNQPSNEEIEILLGLWEVVRRVESNGIVLGNGKVYSGRIESLWTLGVGTFRKRNGATKIALDNAGDRARGSYCASDGFFPFPDSVELLGKAGIKGIIQPGGSLNDKKVIEKANEFGVSMMFTHERAFKH